MVIDEKWLLQVQNISQRDARGVVVSGISFNQKPLQKIAIAGETGSGKSSLLKIIAGLSQADEGSVWLSGNRVKGPNEQLIPGHKGIAYLSQHFELPHFLTVEQVLIYANPLPDNLAQKDEKAFALYKTCQITHLLQRKTDQLSGGEKQRVALTRLLLTAPNLLLLDEPFSNLDMGHKLILKNVIHQLTVSMGLSCIMVSHDPSDTLSWADHILVMRQGSIIQQGTPETIYLHPSDAYTAGLFGKYNAIDAGIAQSIFALPALEKKIGTLFLRPEHFSIATSKLPYSTPATVAQILYYGGYYEVELAMGSFNITLRTIDIARLEKGRQVFLQLSDAFVKRQ